MYSQTQIFFFLMLLKCFIATYLGVLYQVASWLQVLTGKFTEMQRQYRLVLINTVKQLG